MAVSASAEAERRSVHLSLIAVQLSFGGFHVIGKGVLEVVPPLALAGARVLFAAPVLLTVGWLLHRRLPRWRDLPHLALLGLLGVCINQLLFIIGLGATTAINAAILMPSIPVLAVAFALMLGLEPVSRGRALGVVLAVIGAWVMLGVGGFDGGHERSVGNALILLNCASYALYMVLSRPVLARMPPLMVTGWAFLFGGSGVLLVGWPEVQAVEWATLPGPVWAGIGYIVCVPTVLAYFLNSWAIQRSSSTLAATYITLQPVVTAVLASVFRGEDIGPRELVGFVLIVAGLVATTRARVVIPLPAAAPGAS